MNKKVTIVVPTFNREESLPRCIDSVRNQNYDNWELIVVDDGSTDNTDSLMRKYCSEDERIQYLHRPADRLKGANACRNIGIENAKGGYVAFLDSDDEWLSEKLGSDLQLLKEDSNILGIYSGIIISDGTSKYNAIGRSRKENESYVDFIFSKDNLAQTSTYVVNRKAALEVLFDENLQRHQDLDFFIRFGNKYGWKLHNVSNALIHWDGKQKKNYHFPSMIRYYEKYEAQISSAEDHASYLLRQWVSASKTDVEYKKYYIRKLRKLFFSVGLKYKVFSVAPEFCFSIWQKTLESKSKFTVYEEVG